VKSIGNVVCFDFQKAICSNCERPKQASEMYRNRITGKLWCAFCVAEVKRKREAQYLKRM